MVGEKEENIFLIFGKDNAKYHPLQPVGEALAEIAAPVKVVMTQDRNLLAAAGLWQYAMLILYQEFEEKPLNDVQVSGILQYVAAGGTLLVLHNGISVQTNPELAQLIGGVFTGHPPYDALPQVSFHVEDGAHFLMRGVEDFTLPEELYQFEMASGADCKVLCSFSYEGKRCPAVWTRKYGLGSMVYCSVGHQAANLYHPAVRRLLENVMDSNRRKGAESNAEF